MFFGWHMYETALAQHILRSTVYHNGVYMIEMMYVDHGLSDVYNIRSTAAWREGRLYGTSERDAKHTDVARAGVYVRLSSSA